MVSLTEGSTYGFVLGLGCALPPCQNLIPFCYIEIRKVQPLFAADVLDEIALGADRLFPVSEFFIFWYWSKAMFSEMETESPGAGLPSLMGTGSFSKRCWMFSTFELQQGKF